MECRVCAAPATGFHYKISTCRACAAFFRRTVQMKLRYKCRNKGDCKVSKHNRFCCRHCRMKKCIDVGMVVEESEVSSNFHLDPSEASTSYRISPESDNFFSSENIFGNHDEFVKELKERMHKILSKNYVKPDMMYDMYLIQQADLAYRFHEEKWPCKKENLIHDSHVDMNLMVALFYKELCVAVELCSLIKPFASLSMQQKGIMFKFFMLRFIQLDRIAVTVNLLGDDRNDTRIVTLNGQIMNFHNSKFDLSLVSDFNQDQLNELLLCSEVRYDNEFIKPFKLLKPDRFEILYLMMRSMWDIKGYEGITRNTQKIADNILEKLSDELCFYYKYEKKLENPAKRIYKLHNLLIALDRVSEMRKQDQQMTQIFELFKMDVYLADFTIG